jgi:formylglycine-generating enzyme required for sulfatase activity
VEILGILVVSVCFLAGTQAKGQGLREAAIKGDSAAVQQFLQKGASVDDANDQGDTPLMLACVKGNTDVVKILLAAGAKVNAADAANAGAYTPLLIASRNEHWDIVKILLAAGANVNAVAGTGDTPLEFASYWGNAETVSLLLKAGANVNAAAKNGLTPLLVASTKGHAEVVKRLLAAGANIDAAMDGITAIEAASRNGHSDVVQMLSAARAAPTTKASPPKTPVTKKAEETKPTAEVYTRTEHPSELGGSQGAVQKQNQGPAAGAVRTNPVDGAVMVYIPAGEFLMGDDNVGDNPRHTVKLSGYWMYKNLVTVGQYKVFSKATGRRMPPEVVANDHKVIMAFDSQGMHEKIYAYVNFNPNWSKDDHPIVNVTWADAMAYARWAKVDLPTEAQWEKAARGTDGRKYPWGNDFDPDKLWCSKRGAYDAGGTHRVGDLGVSPYGCTDMAGNVLQWCKDWYDEHYWKSDHGSDPRGPGSGSTLHVLRGVEWSIDASSKGNMAAANRHINLGPPRFLNYGVVGFRCAMGTNLTAPPSKTPPGSPATTKAAPPQVPAPK